jgi:hypothetical protein
VMTVMTSAKAKQSSDPLQRRQTLGNPITWLGYARICLDPEELHIFASPEITRERRRNRVFSWCTKWTSFMSLDDLFGSKILNQDL